MIPTNAALRQFIMNFFSDDELETLCFDTFPEVTADFGNKMTKNDKAKALIGYCERHGRLEALCAVLACERPEAWKESHFSTRSAEDLKAFLHTNVEEHSNWHLPDELADLINWKIAPVPIDHYIRLRPAETQTPLLPKERRSSVKPLSQTTLKLSEVLHDRFVVLLGSAGSGKSTCLRYLCHEFSVRSLEDFSQNPDSRSPSIPVLITLKQFGNVNLLSLIHGYFRAKGACSSEKELQSWLASYRVVLLLDGYDEVDTERRSELLSQIQWFHDMYPNSSIVVTGRKSSTPLNINRAKTYVIGELGESAVDSFIQCYLGTHHDEARSLIDDIQVSDLLRTPLLLAFCMVLIQRNRASLETVTEVYQQVVKAYQELWEARKPKNLGRDRLDWLLLEQFLAVIAYEMVSENNSFHLSKEKAIEVLTKEARKLDERLLWPTNQTVLAVLEQLYSQNLLVVEENVVSFWHASFRDYFCALYVLKASGSELIEYAKNPANTAIVAFLGGMVRDPAPLVECLIKNAQESENHEVRMSSVAAIARMGTRFTHEIIRAIIPLDDIFLIEQAYYALLNRSFNGDDLCIPILERILEETLFGYDGVYHIEPNSIHDVPDVWAIINNFERMILSAVAKQDIGYAKEIDNKLERYLDSLTSEEGAYDFWLTTRGFQDVEMFLEALKNGGVEEIKLQEFCRNTTLWTSLPYVRIIRDNTDNDRTRLEANLAVQCLERRYGLSSETYNSV